MRIPASEVLFTGQRQCPEFDVPQELPQEMKVLLCFLDGAERRREIQAKINAVGPEARKKGNRVAKEKAN
jgi:hypothetical protein